MTNTLERKNEVWVAVYAAIVAFITYAIIFGYRKTYTAATFDNRTVFGLGYKEVLVIVQALGYMTSKFFGIRFIAGMQRYGRWKVIISLILIAWISWLLFAITPEPVNIIFLFTNGFPLGLIWGIVFSYIEGRRATDFIGAAMSVSFIFSSGVVKSFGQWLVVQYSIPEQWMPFVAGAIFLPALLFFIWLMEKIPAPTQKDIEARTLRKSMNKAERKAFLRQFLPGLVVLVLLYVFLTIFRDVRDNFVADMLKEMGYGNQPGLFTKTETPATLITLVLIGSLIAIRNNYKALMIVHLIVLAGFLLAGISTLLFVEGMISPITWITSIGVGLYMGYIPYNSVLFERFIATFRISSNVGFLIYLADSFGYLGSVGVILAKAVLELRDIDIQWTKFYSTAVIYVSALGVIGTIVSIFYIRRKFATWQTRMESRKVGLENL